MKVQLESTEKIVEINGQLCRIWEGVTINGTTCHAYIKFIAIAEDSTEQQKKEFADDLQEHAAPSAAIQSIPLRLII